MSNQAEDKLFKYAAKEDGFSFINLIEELNSDMKKYDFESENLIFNHIAILTQYIPLILTHINNPISPFKKNNQKENLKNEYKCKK